MSTIVVGAGIFGVTAALELARRGRAVTLVDPGPVPHPLAESTDISKVVRMDYGSDELYTELGERSLVEWRDPAAPWAGLFHETGVLFVSRDPMSPGGFEHDSLATLVRRGHPLERVGGASLRTRFPAWSELHRDGYFNPRGGFVESGAVVEALARAGGARGVTLLGTTRVAGLASTGSRVSGVRLEDGAVLPADEVIVAAGAWAPDVLPALAPLMRTVGQPVFHLRPADPTPFLAERFPTFGADIARTGYYGFPFHAGVVKIANHGRGRVVHPSSVDERVVTEADHAALRVFLQETFPALVTAEVVATRLCVYCDTVDEHFLIDRVPGHDGVLVAGGGSGHAFKFAPMLGSLVADALDGTIVPRFAWRATEGRTGEEAARARG